MDVPIRCVCPPKADGSPRHEGDTITLRDTLGFVQTQTARNAALLLRADATAAGEGLDPAEVLAVLTEQYVLQGVSGWTLVGEDGKPIPVTRATLRAHLLENEDADDVRTLIADEADGLYARKVMLPLLQTAASSSQPTPTASSTSPTHGSGTEPRDHSSPSSISTIPTAATAKTSKRRAGGSSSSRSSVTAA